MGKRGLGEQRRRGKSLLPLFVLVVPPHGTAASIMGTGGREFVCFLTCIITVQLLHFAFQDIFRYKKTLAKFVTKRTKAFNHCTAHHKKCVCVFVYGIYVLLICGRI